MVFTKPTGYALRALAILPDDGPYVRAGDIARDLDLPAPYLAKILYALSSRGLLEAARGPGGGVRLARPAHRITVGEVAAAFEEVAVETCCLLGLAPCGHRDNPCALRRAWQALETEKANAMAHLTIQDLQVRQAPRATRPAPTAQRRLARRLPARTVA